MGLSGVWGCQAVEMQSREGGVVRGMCWGQGEWGCQGCGAVMPSGGGQEGYQGCGVCLSVG